MCTFVAGNMNNTAHYDSPLGGITLASDGKSLTGLWFLTPSVFDNKVFGSPSGYDGQKHFGSTFDIASSTTSELPVFDKTRRWLDIYFSGRKPDFTPTMLIKGTPFQKRVWTELLTIPYGQTVTYGELARRLGCRSAQAVGGAVGRNPISIIVPCHRVVGTARANDDLPLRGYAGGLDRKRALLELEQKVIHDPFQGGSLEGANTY